MKKRTRRGTCHRPYPHRGSQRDRRGDGQPRADRDHDCLQPGRCDGRADGAEAGIARAIYELGNSAAWAGGHHCHRPMVSIRSRSQVRDDPRHSVRGNAGRRPEATAGRRQGPAAFALYAVLTSTTAALDRESPESPSAMPCRAASAGAVQANNRFGPGRPSPRTPQAPHWSGVTANGPSQGSPAVPGRDLYASLCRVAGAQLDVDSAAATSYKSRALNAVDPVDGLNLYFHGGDATSRCMSGGAWGFDATHTQQCWDSTSTIATASLGQALQALSSSLSSTAVSRHAIASVCATAAE